MIDKKQSIVLKVTSIASEFWLLQDFGMAKATEVERTES